MSVRKMIQISLSIAIVFTQEQLLVFLPNIQLTVVLLLVFSSVFSFKEMLVLIGGYVLLDSMYMGGFNVFYMIPMLLGWSLIPFTHHVLLNKTTDETKLAWFALIFGFVYGWMFIPFVMIQTGITEVWPYLLADAPYEIIMAVTGFVSVLWLYKPLHGIMLEWDTVNPHYKPYYKKG